MVENNEGKKSDLKSSQETTKNSTFSEIVEVVCVITTQKFLLSSIILITAMIAMGTISISFAIEIFFKLNFKELLSDNVSKESTSQLTNFVIELFFGIIFIPWGIFSLKRIIPKLKEMSNGQIIRKTVESNSTTVDNKKIQTKKQNPKIRIFVYVIFFPFIYTILILFSGNILEYTNSVLKIPFLTFENYIVYLLLIFIGVSNQYYVRKWRKIDTEKQFELLGYEYIIKERRILKKIQKISFTILIVASSVFAVYVFVDNTSKGAFTPTLNPLVLPFLSLFFGDMVVFAISTVKLNVDEEKRRFRSYISAGFLQESINAKDKLRIDLLNYGLYSYNIFFKINHKLRIKNIQQITVEILRKNESEQTKSIQEIITSLKSTNDYDALNTISSIMTIKPSELLTDNDIIQKIKDWLLVIVSVIAAIFPILVYLTKGAQV